jgi:hypothetical protein
LPTAKYKVEHWDAGWWQIKKCLVEAGLESGRLQQMEGLKEHTGADICRGALELGIVSSA